MSISQNFPAIQPTLNLNFARSKKLDPRITFNRTSSATRTNALGLIEVVSADTPRFDHSYNSTTGSVNSLGLLIEESRSNLVTYSEQFNDVSWLSGNIGIVTNTTATISPDGSTNAEKLVATAVNGEHLIYKNPGISTGTYTLSVFAKAAGYNFIGIRIDDVITSTQRITLFDLSNGTVGVSANVTSSSITPYPNGWYRCSITATGQVQNYVFQIYPTNTNAIWTGDGTSGVYIWGAQLEAGAFPTSYIPTMASTVTRSADNASITGANFSNWYNPNEGSVVTIVNTASGYGSVAQVYCSISDGTENNRMVLYRVGGGLRGEVAVTVSSVQTNLFPTIDDALNSSKYKMGFAYKTNDMNAVFAGSISSGITTYSVPTSTQLNIGDRATGSRILNGSISQLIYYPVRLPNVQLQSLTSN